MVAAGCVVFLAWFLMKFHMDNSNDSETQAYVAGLLASGTNRTLTADANGHYTALTPYIIWPFATVLEHITGAFLIRGFVFALLLIGLVLNTAAYIWYRMLGLAWLTRLLGLVLLSTSVAFTTQVRGWELDKWLEPALYLMAGIAAWNQRWVAFIAIALVAAANRDTGIFVPFVALIAPVRQNLSSRWPVVVALIGCALEVTLFWRLGPVPRINPFIDLNADRLVYILGGISLLPLLALMWARSSSWAGVRLLVYSLTPVWFAFVLATDRLERGAVLLAPLALLWVPATLGVLVPGASAGRSPQRSAPGT